MKKNNLIFLSIILFGTIALGVIGLCIGLSVKKSDGKPSGNVVVMPKEDIVCQTRTIQTLPKRRYFRAFRQILV